MRNLTDPADRNLSGANNADTTSNITDTADDANNAADPDTAERSDASPDLEQRLQFERWSDYEEEEAAPRYRSSGAGAKTKMDKNARGAKASAPRVVETSDEDGDYSGPLASFFADELIVGTPIVVKSGKEATVYCCQAHPRIQAATGNALLAAKVYRAREHRSFKNYSVYQQGRTTMNTRMDKAIAQKSAKGLAAQFRTMDRGGVRNAVAPVCGGRGRAAPLRAGGKRPAARLLWHGRAWPRPQLASVRLEPEDAARLFAQMRRNLALCMECDRVHGDLSPYNILYWQDTLRIIDFPQAVDPMDNPDAYTLFARDVGYVCEYFAPYGVAPEPRALAFSLWMQSGRPRPKEA